MCACVCRYIYLFKKKKKLVQPSDLEVQNKPRGYSFVQAWLGETSPERARRWQLAEKQNAGASASECTAETDFIVFAKTLMIKEKDNVFGF